MLAQRMFFIFCFVASSLTFAIAADEKYKDTYGFLQHKEEFFRLLEDQKSRIISSKNANQRYNLELYPAPKPESPCPPGIARPKKASAMVRDVIRIDRGEEANFENWVLTWWNVNGEEINAKVREYFGDNVYLEPYKVPVDGRFQGACISYTNYYFRLGWVD